MNAICLGSFEKSDQTVNYNERRSSHHHLERAHDPSIPVSMKASHSLNKRFSSASFFCRRYSFSAPAPDVSTCPVEHRPCQALRIRNVLEWPAAGRHSPMGRFLLSGNAFVTRCSVIRTKGGRFRHDDVVLTYHRCCRTRRDSHLRSCAPRI